MSDEKRFAVYDAVADSVLFDGKDVSEWDGQTVADAINAAVARERREAAAQALREAADERAGDAGDDNVCRWLRTRAAGVERGES